MALITREDCLRRRIWRKVMIASCSGLVLLLLPLTLVITDPMFIIAKYKFRLANGSILQELLQSEMEGGRFSVYLFNITNADQFMSGEDYKLKVQEIGPFTYIEYRNHDNLHISKSGEMSYNPRMRSEFLAEESVADPRDVHIAMPNIPMLSATTMVQKTPDFIRGLYNMLVHQLGSKAIVKMDANKYLWGYTDPVLTVANNLVPGLIHFKTTGIMDRLYDEGTKYHVVLGATDEDKFQVKTVTRYRNANVWDTDDIPESTTAFNDTYEGMAYPPLISKTTPINIYRLGICKSFEMEFCGRKTSEYGPNAFIYKFRDRMFENTHLCNSTGYCPNGLMDMSECFYGLPMGMSKGHFFGGDPALLERIEGLHPNAEDHSSHIVIEPKIGLTLETSWSIQVNIMVGNVNYNSDASRFSDMVLPIAHFKIRQPRLPAIAIKALTLIYITMPKILFAVEITSFIAGLLLLGYSAKLFYWHWILRSVAIDLPADKTKMDESPLVKKL